MAAEAQIDIRVNTEGAQNSLDKFQGAIDTLGGSVEVVFGSLALFGVENEWIKNLEQGAVGAIALADGAKRMTEGIIKFTGATTLAEAAQAAFNAVAAANPYVLLATALIAAAGALFLFKSRAKQAAEEAKKLREEVAKQNYDTIKNIQLTRTQLKNEKLLREYQARVSTKTSKQLTQEIADNNIKVIQQNTQINNQIKALEALDIQFQREAASIEKQKDARKLSEEQYKEETEALQLRTQEQKAAIEFEVEKARIAIEASEGYIAAANAELEARGEAAQAAREQTQAEKEAAAERARIAKEQKDALIADAIALEDELFLLRLSAQDREETEAQQLFDERVARANGNADLIKQAEEQFLTDLKTIRDNYAADDIQAKKEQNAAAIQAQQDLYDELFALSLSDQDRAELEAQQLFDERVAAANDNAELIKMAEQQLVDDLNKIRKDAGDKATEENQKAIDIQLEAESALYNAKMQLAYASIEVLKEVAGENQKIQNVIFAAEKALAIGELVTNLAKEVAANNANPTWSALPDGGKVVKAIFNTAARVRTAAAIAAIAKSTIAQFKSGGGNLTAGSTTPGFTLASNVNANANQQTTPPTVQSGGPVQAYVLAGDVTDGIEAQQKLNSRRTL